MKLDDLLASALFPKSRKAGEIIPKRELLEKYSLLFPSPLIARLIRFRFLDKLAKFHQVNRGELSEIRYAHALGMPAKFLLA
jgi:hypothetical protein